MLDNFSKKKKFVLSIRPPETKDQYDSDEEELPSAPPIKVLVSLTSKLKKKVCPW